MCSLIVASPALAQWEGADDPLPPDVERNVYAIDAEVSAIEGERAAVEAASSGLQVTETADETRIDMASDILFDFDRSNLRPEAEAALRQLAELLRERARGTIRIEGHTDSKGSVAYNQRLSEARALSVENWLLRNGRLTGVEYESRGFGASRPVASNTRPDGSDDPDGRQRNRRVEIVIGRGS